MLMETQNQLCDIISEKCAIFHDAYDDMILYYVKIYLVTLNWLRCFDTVDWMSGWASSP